MQRKAKGNCLFRGRKRIVLVQDFACGDRHARGGWEVRICTNLICVFPLTLTYTLGGRYIISGTHTYIYVYTNIHACKHAHICIHIHIYVVLALPLL